MDQIYIGVDVAKAWLDVYHPARGAKRIENTPSSVRSFARAAAREGVWVIFEASGGYDRVLRDGLEDAQVSFSRVNPHQARDFARAMGVIGKTDRVDARTPSTSKPSSITAARPASSPPSNWSMPWNRRKPRARPGSCRKPDPPRSRDPR